MYVKVKCLISRCIGVLGLLVLWPVFFKQQRLGLKGKPFEIYKFRSMCVGAERMGSGVYSNDGDPRVTKVGRILRATSLDELPQLINLANGTMHLISCRPPLLYHPWSLEEYSKAQLHMFDLWFKFTEGMQIHNKEFIREVGVEDINEKSVICCNCCPFAY